jgi:ATP-dependent Clp protease ATP-binding subunit ClpC
MNELEKNDDIILFIDEIHTIVVQVEQPDLWMLPTCLNPLARGEIQCIGATTLDEYRKKDCIRGVFKDNC